MKKVQQSKSITKIVGYYLTGVLIGLMGIVALMRLIWHSKYYPNVVVGNVEIEGMTRAEAKRLLEQKFRETNIGFSYNGYQWEIAASEMGINLEETLNDAYRVGRRLKLTDYVLVFVNKPIIFPLKMYEGYSEKYEALFQEMARAIEIPGVEAELTIVKNRPEITNGIDGVIIDRASFNRALARHLGYLDTNRIIMPTTEVKTRLNEVRQNELKVYAEKLINKNLILRAEDERIKLAANETVSLLDTQPNTEEIYDIERVQEYVDGLAESINRDPVDAKFGFEGGKVTEFAPGKDGLKLDIDKTTKLLIDNLKMLAEGEEKEISVEVALNKTPPQVTMDKVNELGIKERIGRGESYYAHSIPNRIYNVGLASSRINTALVAPGETVSFNKLVGEVSAATGYRSAYIISQGRTVLGDGGGLCQVSTTLFRAAMNAGLPILERWGHSYRVSYYELNSKPGVDATVIAPSKDFRFKNDTPGHILIQTINDPKNLHLVVEIYGTSDGRVASVTESKVWGITPPLPTVYQDDPSLPAGTMKQVDWAAGGARASFEYKVTRDGETLQDQTFTTVYRPWAAVYLRGTGQ